MVTYTPGVDDRRPLVCPVLVARNDLLALADCRVAEVLAGPRATLPAFTAMTAEE
jgi:hypothetical protein